MANTTPLSSTETPHTPLSDISPINPSSTQSQLTFEASGSSPHPSSFEISPVVAISPSLSDNAFSYLSSVPSTSSEQQPVTPFVGQEIPSFLTNSIDWISVGLCVQIKENYTDQNMIGQCGEVRGINVILICFMAIVLIWP